MATDTEILTSNSHHAAALLLGFDRGVSLDDLIGHVLAMDQIGRQALADTIVADDQAGDVVMCRGRRAFVAWVEYREKLERSMMAAFGMEEVQS